MDKIDVVALGELLIDFTENGVSGQGNPLFEANPGGAPCNVLAMLSKLGRSTEFIGKVGGDLFGRQLKETLTEAGIGTSGLITDVKCNTTLAFVHTMENGDRDFSFFRNPGADTMLRKAEIKESLIAGARIFHFGSLSLTDEPAREATVHALKTAKRHGIFRSFDPNLRPPLWRSDEDARAQIRFGLAHCDVLKISDNEIVWLTGKRDFTDGVRVIRREFDIPLICVSMGREGSRAYYEDYMVEAPAFIQKNTVETTGAGDTFCACVLDYVLKCGLFGASGEGLKNMLLFANAAASLVTTRKGALRVMPSFAEVMEVVRQDYDFS